MTKYFLCFVLLVSALQAAIPPMSDDMKEMLASDVVFGTVTHISRKDVQVRGENNPEFVDRHFTVKILVNRFLKSSTEDNSGSVITVTYWKPFKRPQGWTGGQGQNNSVSNGDFVKLWLSREDNGTYKILEPNGIEIIKPHDQL